MRRPGYEGAFWPTPLQQGVLDTILLPDEAARGAWLRIRPGLTMADLWDTEVHRALPLVLRALRRMGIDDPGIPTMEGVARRAWFANQMRIRGVAPTIGRLEAAGISTMLLKGMPVAIAYYGDLSLRPMGDVDVLVPAAQREQAVDLLVRDGWRAIEHVDPAFNHGVGFIHPDGRALDLHWQPSMTWVLTPRDVAAADGLWAMAEPLDFGGVRTRVPCPADMLIHLCVHGAWANSGATLRWITDATCVMRTAGARMDWDLVIDRIAQSRLGPQMTGPLHYLSRFGDPAVPPGVREAVAAMPSTRRERRHHRVSVCDTTRRRRTGHLRAAVATWFHRTTRRSRREALRDLLPYLRQHFGVARTRDIPRIALGKAIRTITGRGESAPALPQTPHSAGGIAVARAHHDGQTGQGPADQAADT